MLYMSFILLSFFDKMLQNTIAINTNIKVNLFKGKNKMLITVRLLL